MEPKTLKRPDSTNRSQRPRRSAVGGKRDVLKADGNLDYTKYHYYIVNEENIAEFQSYGYEIDESNDVNLQSSNGRLTGSQASAVVDRKTGKKAVLMRQPIEFHNEDKKLRALAIDESEESMLRDLKEAEGRYGSVKTRE